MHKMKKIIKKTQPKIFYDRLIKVEEIFIELDQYEIELEEKNELASIIDETLHNHALRLILSNLPEKHHEEFLTMFHESPHNNEILVFIKERVQVDIECLLVSEAEKVKKEIFKDIKGSKRKK